MTLEGQLRMLDFTDNEIKVYLVLLKIGTAQAGRIAKECVLERTSTYNALKRLQEKGMVSSVIEANTQVFAAASPEKILDVFKEKEERAKLLIPQLEQLKTAKTEKETILKFRGYAGVKTVLNDILKTCKSGDEYLILGPERQLSERMPTFARIFVAQKDKKRIRARIILRQIAGNNVMSKYTEARYVPQEVFSPTVTSIYGDKIALIVWSETPEAIIIDNADTAKTYRTYFEFIWKHAKKSL
ncbi:hypothetical protein J4219_05905 [Candidatus Woesearchaeota archaeon]|nr:hypothetical protein [Candidatus Woesearchaeota archaeon]